MKKILIANRGEIACRVMKTAKSLGIATVAVYSDADKQARHVQMADEAVAIGPAAAAESYLVAEKIIEACKQTGADAVHPGYGFLSERASFCEALSAAGITFVGPPPGAIEAMGDKITSKKIAQDAGVSTVPGYMGLIADADEAVKISTEIGYPVMIKASAGGGGKGMRIAWNDDEAREGFERSKSEAASSFGDDRIFIEKFVVEPRHIEIQVLADQHGNCVYLGERECSIQRRNQKVIEEAPSPFLDAATRKAMGEQSVALAQAVGYVSAGTVEFIVDKDKNFYFLEMNTRLQVEHPVTELITGVDLVEQMIRVADGHKLDFTQEDVTLTGWAIESRLYAEDPYRNFLPSIGRLTRYRPPVEVHEDAYVVRNDTGVYEGGEISMYYDPMIAKLCSWAPTRGEAIDVMANALDGFELEGIGHNLPFLSAVMEHPRFQSGNISTAFIAEEYPEGFAGVEMEGPYQFALQAAALLLQRSDDERRAGETQAFATSLSASQEKTIICGTNATEAIIAAQDGQYAITIDGQTKLARLAYQPGDGLAALTLDDEPFIIKVSAAAPGYRLRLRGIDEVLMVFDSQVGALYAHMPAPKVVDTSNLLLCPMPGLVVSLMVEEGQHVEEGQPLVIIEAMKMENVLRAEKAATISALPVAEGDSLSVDDIIMEFE